MKMFFLTSQMTLVHIGIVSTNYVLPQASPLEICRFQIMTHCANTCHVLNPHFVFSIFPVLRTSVSKDNWTLSLGIFIQLPYKLSKLVDVMGVTPLQWLHESINSFSISCKIKNVGWLNHCVISFKSKSNAS